jgi:hypothetical protein
LHLAQNALKDSSDTLLKLIVSLELLELTIYNDELKQLSFEPSKALENVEKNFGNHEKWSQYKILFFIRCSKIWFNMDTYKYLEYIENELKPTLSIGSHQYKYYLIVKLAQIEKSVLNGALNCDNYTQMDILFDTTRERLLRLTVDYSSNEYLIYIYFLAQFLLLQFHFTKSDPDHLESLEFLVSEYKELNKEYRDSTLWKYITLSVLELQSYKAILQKDEITFKQTEMELSIFNRKYSFSNYSITGIICQHWKWMWTNIVKREQVRCIDFFSDRVDLLESREIELKGSMNFLVGSHLMYYRINENAGTIVDICPRNCIPERLRSEEDLSS